MKSAVIKGIAGYRGTTMYLDVYTKVVLTVIAGALVVLAAQNAIGTSRAQSDQVQKVQICSNDGINCAAVGQPAMGGQDPIGVAAYAFQTAPWTVTNVNPAK